MLGTHSSLHHMHKEDEEFIYVLEGNPTLFVGDKSEVLQPGLFSGF